MYYPAGFCDIFITGAPGRLRCKRIGDSIITGSICPACKSPTRVIYNRQPDYACRRRFFPAKLVFQESVHTSLLHGSCVAKKLARRLAFVDSWRWLNKSWGSLFLSNLDSHAAQQTKMKYQPNCEVKIYCLLTLIRLLAYFSASTKHLYNICTTSTLYKSCTNVLCFLGCHVAQPIEGWQEKLMQRRWYPVLGLEKV